MNSKVVCIDQNIGNVKIINIAPVEIFYKRWLCVAFERSDEYLGDMMHFALMYADDISLDDDLVRQATTLFKDSKERPLLRMHSECLLGDALNSDLCDCGEQLKHALQAIMDNHGGILLYLRQEGRGIGMRAKLACLAAQEGYVGGVRRVEPMSPDTANIFCGFRVDERDYSVASDILQALQITDVDVMTGNVDKINALRQGGINIHGLSDITRHHIPKDSRKYRELKEKTSRNYLYAEKGLL